MFLIVGLGNPGIDYINTRHNIGFDAIDYIADKYNININREKFKGVYGEGRIDNEKVILFKPTTYMNLSGEAIRLICDFYKIDNSNIIIIYDDISLDVGRLRIREKGSAGGHNGIKSIISNLNSDIFSRIKIGVGAPKGDLVKHVLGKFNGEDRKILNEILDIVNESVKVIINEDTKEAMNKYNGVNLSKQDC
ncbi:MAG: aminoacyl-tRNA hydrolase [Clostridiales bacterium]|nr:aminoacyl-tRNA hydrolase [Clostridiales bacterium]